MNSLWYFFAAFSIVWAVIWGYTFLMSRKHANLFKKIEQLKSMLNEKNNKNTD